jgi:hypothetical protein
MASGCSRGSDPRSSRAVSGNAAAAVVRDNRAVRFPRDDLETIRATINSLGEPVDPMPSDEHLAEILDVLFFATLEYEEREPVTVAIGYVERDGPHSAAVHPLAKATPVDVRSLRKLAGAIAPERSFLAVEPGPSGLQIWGLGLLPRLIDEPLGFGSDAGAWLIARGTGAGVLELQVFGVTIWLYERGRSSQPPPVVATFATFARALATRIDDPRPLLLVWLTRRLAAAGHGGTLVLVRPGRLDNIDLPDRKRLKPPHRRLREAFDAYFEGRQKLTTVGNDDDVTGAYQRLQHVNRLSDELDIVARLASVDGAVVLGREELDVLGLGAMLIADDPPLRVLQASLGDEDFEEVSLAELGGARHQSAVRWCAKYGPQGFVIVVSQDGAASFVRAVGGAVIAIRALQLGRDDQGLFGPGIEYAESSEPTDFLRLDA